MPASFGEIHAVDINAPSGTSRRRERETFFNNELSYLLDMASADILLSDDFNCVLDAGDSTGHGSYSRSLKALIICEMRGRPDRAIPPIHITPSMEPPAWTVFT